MYRCCVSLSIWLALVVVPFSARAASLPFVVADMDTGTILAQHEPDHRCTDDPVDAPSEPQRFVEVGTVAGPGRALANGRNGLYVAAESGIAVTPRWMTGISAAFLAAGG